MEEGFDSFEDVARFFTRKIDNLENQMREHFVGIPYRKAKIIANIAEVPHRLVKRDDKIIPIEDDYNPQRINFTVDNNIVTDVTFG